MLRAFLKTTTAGLNPERGVTQAMRATVHTGLGMAGFQVLTLAASVMIARALSPAGQGRFQVLVSMSVALATVAKLGLDESATFIFPMLKNVQPARLRGAVWYVAVAPIIVTTLLSTLVYSFSPFIVGHVFKMPDFDSDLQLLVPLSIATTALFSTLGLVRALGRPDLRAWIYYFGVGPVLTLAVLILYIANSDSSRDFAAARALVFGFAGVFGLSVALKLAPKGKKLLRPEDVRKLHGLGAFVAVNGLLQIVVDQPIIDLAIVSSVGSAEQVGTYAVAARAAGLLSLVPGAFVLITGPAFAKHVAQASLNDIQSVYASASGWMAKISLFLAGGLLIFRREALLVFGTAYVDAADVLMVLVVGYLIVGILGPTAPLMIALGRAKLDFLLVSGAAVLMVGMGLVLGHLHGPIGVAIGTSVSAASLSIARRIAIAKFSQVRGRSAVAAVLAMVGSLVASGWLKSEIAGPGLAVSLAAGVAYVVFFGSTLFALERSVFRRRPDASST